MILIGLNDPVPLAYQNQITRRKAAEYMKGVVSSPKRGMQSGRPGGSHRVSNMRSKSRTAV